MAGRQHAPNSEYALNSEVRLITRFYGSRRSTYLSHPKVMLQHTNRTNTRVLARYRNPGSFPELISFTGLRKNLHVMRNPICCFPLRLSKVFASFTLHMLSLSAHSRGFCALVLDSTLVVHLTLPNPSTTRLLLPLTTGSCHVVGKTTLFVEMLRSCHGQRE